MRLEAITLVLTVAAGTLLVAGWAAPEGQATPEAALSAPTPVQRTSNPYWEYVPVPDDLARGPGSMQAAIPPLWLT